MVAIPRERCNSLLVVGTGNVVMGKLFASVGLNQPADQEKGQCPKSQARRLNTSLKVAMLETQSSEDTTVSSTYAVQKGTSLKALPRSP